MSMYELSEAREKEGERQREGERERGREMMRGTEVNENGIGMGEERERECEESDEE